MTNRQTMMEKALEFLTLKLLLNDTQITNVQLNSNFNPLLQNE